MLTEVTWRDGDEVVLGALRRIFTVKLDVLVSFTFTVIFRGKTQNNVSNIKSQWQDQYLKSSRPTTLYSEMKFSSSWDADRLYYLVFPKVRQ